MKKLIYLLVASLVVFGFSSCEDVVQVELDEGSKLYVVDAFVTDQAKIQSIKVTESASYFSNQESPAVSNAQVELKDRTANTVYTFTYSSNGRYIYDATQKPPIANLNHVYELNVTVDGSTYTSTSKQKRSAVIDSISAIYMEGGGFGPPTPYYNCFLWARDVVDHDADYYWVKTFRNDTLFGDPGDLNMAIDGTGGEVYEEGVDTLDFTPPAIFLGFKNYQKGDVCKVEIHSISRECYNFLLQAVLQIQNGGLFATTPENVKTNIVTPKDAKTKAVGWFNMATVTTKSKTVQ